MKPEVRHFLDSLREAKAPADRSALIQSVWWGLKGDWHQAHEIAQDVSGADAAWVHAWLHRLEGDLTNARYWYRRAQRDLACGDIRVEGEAIAAQLLGQTSAGA